MDKLTTKEEREIKKKEKMERDAQEKKKQQMTNVTIWAGIAIVLLGSIFVIYKASQNSSTGGLASQNTQQLAPVQNLAPVGPQDMTRGAKNAKVTLIEYADFQCPACKYYHPIVNQLYDAYKNKVLFVYRFFPLINLHEHAMVSAEAAYAASKQGKFWQMGDLLFNNQDSWATAPNYQSQLDGFARQLGLNVSQFDIDMASPQTAQAINASEDTGIKIGVQGTPTFVIDGKQIVNNPQTYDDFKKLIDQELQTQSKTK